jgi:hypothetical protein
VENFAILEAQEAGVKKVFYRLLFPTGQAFSSSNMSYWKDIDINEKAIKELLRGSGRVFETIAIRDRREEVRILYVLLSPTIILQVGQAMESYSRFLDAFGPADDQRDAQAALVKESLAGAERRAVRDALVIQFRHVQPAPSIEPTDDPSRTDETIAKIIPDDPDKPYDVKEVIVRTVDNGDFLEVQPLWAQNIVVGFARLNGKAVGVVANQPKHYAGALDTNSSMKAGRFIRFCDAFNIPILIISALNALCAIALNDFLAQRYVSILNAVLSAGTGVLGSIQLYMKINEKMTNSVRASTLMKRWHSKSPKS